MSQLTINIGTAANKGNGDTLRNAFIKVNSNFTELYNLLLSTAIDVVPPDTPNEGALWWDPVGGRLYISYGGDWIDASPVDGISDDSYIPETSNDWSGTPPTTITAAIDRLATLVKSLNNDTGA